MKYLKSFESFSFCKYKLIREFSENPVSTNQIIDLIDAYSKQIKINNQVNDRQEVLEKQKEFKSKIIDECSKFIIELLNLESKYLQTITSELEKIILIERIDMYINWYISLKEMLPNEFRSGILVHHFYSYHFSKHEFNIEKVNLQNFLNGMILFFSKFPFKKDFILSKNEISFFDKDTYNKQLDLLKKKLKNVPWTGTWDEFYTKLSNETDFSKEDIIRIRAKEMLSSGKDKKKIIKETGLTEKELQEISTELSKESESKDTLSNNIYLWNESKDILEQILFSYQDKVISVKDEIDANTLNKMKVIQKGLEYMNKLQEANDFNYFEKINIKNTETLKKSLKDYYTSLKKVEKISNDLFYMRNHNYQYNMNPIQIFINILYNISERIELK